MAIDVKFNKKRVRQHIRRHHPGCPNKKAKEIAYLVARKEWTRCRLGKAVGITLQNFVRHRMTEYDELLETLPIHRLDARLIIKKQVEEIIAAWASAPSCLTRQAVSTENHRTDEEGDTFPKSEAVTGPVSKTE